MNGRTKMTRANSLRTSRCLLFSLFCCYFLIYFILLVFVSTYFTFVGHCSYTIYIIQLPRRKGISITCYYCAWGTYPLCFFANYFYCGTFHVVLRNSHLLLCFCLFVFKFNKDEICNPCNIIHMRNSSYLNEQWINVHLPISLFAKSRLISNITCNFSFIKNLTSQYIAVMCRNCKVHVF